MRFIRVSRIIATMFTVIEHPTFQRQAAAIWRDEEREAFINWIACNPLAGDVIPDAEGARKVRWSASGRGKRGGARVIYFNWLDEGCIELFAVYAKAERANMTAAQVRRQRKD